MLKRILVISGDRLPYPGCPTTGAGLRRVIEDILDDPGGLVERSRQAQQLVREHFTWDRAITPLDAFCRNPVKRPKAAPILPDHSGFQWDLACEQFVFHLRQEGIRRDPEAPLRQNETLINRPCRT